VLWSDKKQIPYGNDKQKRNGKSKVRRIKVCASPHRDEDGDTRLNQDGACAEVV
jgi:hypothetical protein